MYKNKGHVKILHTTKVLYSIIPFVHFVCKPSSELNYGGKVVKIKEINMLYQCTLHVLNCSYPMNLQATCAYFVFLNFFVTSTLHVLNFSCADKKLVYTYTTITLQLPHSLTNSSRCFINDEEERISFKVSFIMCAVELFLLQLLLV